MPPPQATTQLTEREVQQMIEAAVDEALSEHETRLREHIDTKFNQLSALIVAAFPNGDVHGHKAAHERQIADANRWTQLKTDFISKAFTTGMMGAVGFLLIAVWEWFKGEVRK